MKFNIRFLKNWLGKKINYFNIVEKLNFSGFETTIEKNIVNVIVPYNRPNFNNLFGIIQELSGLIDIRYFKTKCKKLKQKIHNKNEIINIKETNFCPVYISIIIKDFDNKIKTDKKIENLLKQNDIKLHNYIVNLTNYILLVTGQPLHAYDLEKINSKINIVKIKKNISFNTLNECKINLKKNTITISDDSNRVLALPGIIGSSYAKVDKDTTNIIIECAIFEKNCIKKIANQYKLKTDSSNIFGNGVNIHNIDIACNYFLKILNKSKNTKIKIYKNQYKLPFKKKYINIKNTYINKIIGKKIKCSIIDKYLKKKCIKYKKYVDYRKIKIPYNRPDITIPESIISEILKCYGYEKIKPQAIISKAQINTTYENQNTNKLRNYLINSGFNEVINYSFVEDKLEHTLLNRNFLKIKNPMSDKMNIMRSSLLQGLLKNILNNISRNNNDLNFFEIGNIWTHKNQENLNLGIITGNDFLFTDLYNTEKVFYVIKNIIENIANILKKHITFKKNNTTIKCIDQQISCEIYINNLKIGIIGKVNNIISNSLLFKKNIYFAELYLSKIYTTNKTEPNFLQISKFPKIIRDISFDLKKEIEYQNIYIYIKTIKINNLKEFYLLSTYIDNKNEKKTLTFRFVFQSIKNTLTDELIKDEINKINEKISKKFNAFIKGFNDNNCDRNIT